VLYVPPITSAVFCLNGPHFRVFIKTSFWGPLTSLQGFPGPILFCSSSLLLIVSIMKREVANCIICSPVAVATELKTDAVSYLR
jgi:hypothetical protein